ncbi:MAG: zinc-ribbon domain containing protein [Pseudomonadota bacterium]
MSSRGGIDHPEAKTGDGMQAKKAMARAARRRKRAVRRLKRATETTRYVDHPRYGNRPILSGERWTLEQIRQAYWGYCRQQVIYPESAITADLSRQRFGYAPRRVYVDMEQVCRTCRRKFLFFALEQKFWFEVLGFFCDAQCHHCQECRHERHLFQRSIEEYGDLLKKAGKSRKDWGRLEELGTALFELGYITKPETLLKSRMPKRLRRQL